MCPVVQCRKFVARLKLNKTKGDDEGGVKVNSNAIILHSVVDD